MCRWLAYSGAPLLLEELLFKTEHSLIDQSLTSAMGAETTNGDGFGVGWYGNQPTPGLYRDIQPAWNNENLRDLAAQIESRLFLAHVRAATSGVQQSNCHPFRHGRWLFVHNGLINELSRFKRALVMAVAPELFNHIKGTTDSELMFYLALTLGLDQDALPALERMAGLVDELGRQHGVVHPLQMTLGISDGQRLIGVRYSSERSSRTLFLSRNTEALRDVHPDLRRFSDDARAIVSEPLSNLSDEWQEIPECTAVIVQEGQMTTHDFTPKPPS